MNNRRKINHRGHRVCTENTEEERGVKILSFLFSLCAPCLPSVSSVVNSSFDQVRKI